MLAKFLRASFWHVFDVKPGCVSAGASCRKLCLVKPVLFSGPPVFGPPVAPFSGDRGAGLCQFFCAPFSGGVFGHTGCRPSPQGRDPAKIVVARFSGVFWLLRVPSLPAGTGLYQGLARRPPALARKFFAGRVLLILGSLFVLSSWSCWRWRQQCCERRRTW